MDYKVVLIQSEEGYSVSCPSLRGCYSQGATMDEAIENIKSAIREWLDTETPEESKPPAIERIVTVYPNVALHLSCAGKRIHVVQEIYPRCLVTAQGKAEAPMWTSQSPSALDDFVAKSGRFLKYPKRTSL